MKRIGVIGLLCLTLVGCDQERSYTYQSDGKECCIKLETVNDSTWEVQHFIGDSLTDVWTLCDSVYQFDCGDLTGDGRPEILVGVIRATRYRPEPDKRLFIFKLFKGRKIRPLWLGSRVGLPLIDFKVERYSVPAMVHTWERDTDGTTVEVMYRQQGFGLKYVKTLPKENVKIEKLKN